MKYKFFLKKPSIKAPSYPRRDANIYFETAKQANRIANLLLLQDIHIDDITQNYH